MSQISVTIHEKRNHPYEYGHFDCSVTITESFDPKDTYVAIEKLREIARLQVFDECDMWIEGIENQRKIVEMRGWIKYNLTELARPTNQRIPLYFAKRVLRLANEMACLYGVDEYDMYRDLLFEALLKRRENIDAAEERRAQLQKAKDECIALRDDYENGDGGDYEEEELLF